MNRTRRCLPILTAAAAVSLAACGGGGSGSPSVSSTEGLRPTIGAATASVDDVNGAKASAACAAQVKTLRVNAIGSLNDATKVAKTYMEGAHPGLKVDLSTTAGSYGAVVQQVSADKAAGRTTDVAVAGFDYLPTFARQLGAQTLSPRLLRASYDQRYVNLGKVDGRFVGIPQQVSIPVIMYNKTMLAKAGVDPSTLATTDGVLAAAAKLKTANSSVQPIDLPTNGFGQWYLNDLAGSKGSGTQAKDGQPQFDTPATQEAAAFLAKVGTFGTQSVDPVTGGLIRFGTQKSAMVAATIASVAQVSRILAQQKGNASFPIGTIPFPTLPGGKQAPVAGGNALVVLSTTTCQKEMATEFVVAMLTPNVIAASTKSVSYLPVDTTAATQLAGFYQQFPDLAAINTLIPSLVAPPSWGGARGNEVPDAASDAVLRIFKGANPATTLAALQTQAVGLTK